MRDDATPISAEAPVSGSFVTPWDGEAEFTCIGSAPKAPLDVAPNSRAAVGAGADGGTAAKLDTPDAKGGKMEPGPRGEKIDGKDDKAPIPKFTLSAYNGGPMRLAGYSFPVIIDATGVRFAAPKIPIYVGHLGDGAPASEMMETLVGQAVCACNDGRITAGGDVTGDTKTVRAMLDHSRKGFKFQTSVHGRPVEMGFIAAGETGTVNGRKVSGPVSIARQSVIDHIAILPLGADTTTSARIAAQNAAGDTNMEFTAWLKAEYGLEQAAFDALPDAGKAKIKAAFDAASRPASKPDPAPAKKDADPAPIKATGAVADTAEAIKAQNAALASNMERVAKINELAKDHPAIAAQAIGEGWTVEKTENAVLKAQRDSLTKDTFGPAVITDQAKKAQVATSSVVEAATLLSCGYSASGLMNDRRYGERVLNLTDDFYRMERTHVITPSKLARIVARYNGVNLPDGHGDDFWTEALANERICRRGGERIMPGISAEFSTITLPTALSNVMNKFMLDAYLSVDPNDCDPAGGVAWKQFTRVSSVQDFKPHYRVRMVATLLLQNLLKGGEIRHGTVGEQSYMLTADTKAIMLGINRKDLINDDMSALSTLPTHFGIGAAETVASDIYTCLIADKQSDGSTAFFTSSAVTTEGNKMGANLTTSAGLGFATLEAARARFAAQTKPNGYPAGILGRVLLVPPGLAALARQLCESDYLIANLVAANSSGSYRGVPANNTLKGLQKPVSSAYLANLSGGSATTWYLLAPATAPAYTIEVGFLNGQEVPVIERAEADFSRLGISFRCFLDYGVAMGEPRAAQKQTA